jgi:hypothetical protein
VPAVNPTFKYGGFVIPDTIWVYGPPLVLLRKILYVVDAVASPAGVQEILMLGEVPQVPTVAITEVGGRGLTQ